MTRAQALEAGERFYTGGRPCKHCQGTNRYSKNGECVDCRARVSREHYWNNKAYRERRLTEFEDRYWNLSGVELARERLRQRRTSALRRMAERNDRQGS